VEPLLSHIAEACLHVAPSLEPWATLRKRVHSRRPVPAGVLPHWSRFAVLIGMTRHGEAPPAWLMRDE
jgi:hypothetical protein